MSQNNTTKRYKTRKFKVFVCYNKDSYEKALVLESVLKEKGFGVHMNDNASHGNFISMELKDMIRSSICFIAFLTSNFLNSSLINQEIGYAQGKGLKVVLIINEGLEDKIQDMDKKIAVVKINEDCFKQQCISVADQVTKISQILDDPIDVESFLEFYTASQTEPETSH